MYVRRWCGTCDAGSHMVSSRRDRQGCDETLKEHVSERAEGREGGKKVEKLISNLFLSDDRTPYRP